MAFEKQIHRLLDGISQIQTKKEREKKKTRHMEKTKHRRDLWAAGQSAEDQQAHVLLSLTGLSFFDSPAVFFSDFLCAS